MTALTGCNKTDKITDTTKNPAIKIGSDNYPPYNFLNEDGMPTGIDVDLATEAFGRMGYKIEIISISWEQKKKLTLHGDSVLLGDSVIHNYRFCENYYFVSGDKMVNSKDSRYWGLLPEPFIVGRAWLVWKSVSPNTGKMRWKRIFKRID